MAVPEQGFDAAATAVAIARVRADEGRLPAEQQLFADPYAALFGAHDAAPEITARMLSVPYLREQVRLRTRFIDDTVRSVIAAGWRQLVLLGVGFDCRALRLPEIAASGTTVFEADFAAQLARKAQVLARAGIATPAWVRSIPCDFAAPDFTATLAAALAAGGFRRAAGTLFIWEGVIGYLDDAAVDRSLRFMAETGGANTWLAFNYGTFHVDTAALPRRLTRAGFATLDEIGCDALHRQWLGGDPPELAALFRLALARR